MKTLIGPPTLRSLLLLAALSWILLPGLALADEAGSKPPEQAPAEETQAMGEERAYGEPVEEHEFLKKYAGAWEVEMTMTGQDGEPITAKGMERGQVVFGGRYLHSHLKTDLMGRPFEGMFFMGFNPMTGVYEWVWTDNQTTHMTLGTGMYDEETDTFYTEAIAIDPATGEEMLQLGEDRFTGDNERHFTMYMQSPDGERTKVMEASYKKMEK